MIGDMSELPMDIIMRDILSRLPVDTLLSFRSVSKSWCSSIDSSYFVKTHLNRSIQHHTNLTLIIRGLHTKSLYSLDLDTLDATLEEFHTKFKNFDVLGSYNGLLLLQSPYKRRLIFFNPSTRKRLKLPEIKIDNADSVKIGLGYDSLNNDYKVVKVVQFCKSLECVENETLVYSLKSNLWKRIGDFPWFLQPEYNWGAHVNGALHMVISFESRKMIVAFDVREENFYLVPQPDFWINQDFYMTVGVLEDCLCVVGAYDAYHTDIWVMENYGVKGSWMKLSSMLLNPIAMNPPGVFVNILCYSKSRNEILLTCDNETLIWYDLRKREAMDVGVRNTPSYIHASLCVRSLVHFMPVGKKVNRKRNAKSKNNERR